jgi:probable rRNA maturation factor
LSIDPSVVALDEQSTRPVKLEQWQALACDVLVAEGIASPAELNLTFIDIDEMTELNIEHMEGTGPTDVLSFPLDDSDDVVFADQPRLLGDVVICPEVVAKQAPDTTEDEMALMVVHGVLHILGMDHQEPDEELEMKAAEQRHLDAWRSQR